MRTTAAGAHEARRRVATLLRCTQRVVDLPLFFDETKCPECRAEGVHRMDLSTGMWSRVTNDTFSYSYGSPVASAVFDPQTKRYYLIHDQFHAQNYLLYLDAIDWRAAGPSCLATPAS